MSRRRALFVTGTDTGVGKTVAAAAVLHRYRAISRDARSVPGRTSVALRYWKPIQTGIEQDDDTATVRRLGCHEAEVLEAGIRLERPLSPHLAARLSGGTIIVQDLIELFAAERSSAAWVVEGVDVHAKLPWLSAYLGHQNVLGTEVYLKATPQLLQLASQRFEQHSRKRRLP